MALVGGTRGSVYPGRGGNQKTTRPSLGLEASSSSVSPVLYPETVILWLWWLYSLILLFTWGFGGLVWRPGCLFGWLVCCSDNGNQLRLTSVFFFLNGKLLSWGWRGTACPLN